jgi:tRNA pseudouridine13 synthase
LWGEGDILSQGEAAELERLVAARFQCWTAGLAANGLRQERRPLRLRPEGLKAETVGGLMELTFSLPAGAYATSVLRELVDWYGPEI